MEKPLRRPRKKRSRLPLLLAGAGLLALVLAVLIFLPKEPDTPGASQPAAGDKTVIHLVAGGDLNVTDKTVAAGFADGSYDYSKVFLDVAQLFAEAEAAVLNFEGSLCGSPYGSETCSAPREMVESLAGSGVDFLQMANSKSIHSGILGLEESLNGIRALGLEPLGAFADSKDFAKTQGFTLRDIGGIRVAIVAFTKGMDGMGLPAGSESCVNLLYTDYTSTYKKIDTGRINRILDAVNQAQPDITIALLHWGSENSTTISPSQERIVKLLQQQGVDAIIGTHSHQVQNINYDAEAGTLVAYGLGDFFGNAETSGSQYSILLDLEITKENGKTTITGWKHIPLYTLTPERDGVPMQVMQIRSAMALYENSHITGVSAQTYENMKAALAQIEKRIQPYVKEK